MATTGLKQTKQLCMKCVHKFEVVAKPKPEPIGLAVCSSCSQYHITYKVTVTGEKRTRQNSRNSNRSLN